MSVNKVIIIGNVGRDAEIRFSQKGSPITNVSIATSYSWKDKASGEKKEETEWHRVALFNRLAEVAGEYLKKGKSVYIEGRLRTRKWTDKDGIERHTTEIVAEEMKFLGGKSQEKEATKSNGIDGLNDDIPKSNGIDGLNDDIPF